MTMHLFLQACYAFPDFSKHIHNYEYMLYKFCLIPTNVNLSAYFYYTTIYTVGINS